MNIYLIEQDENMGYDTHDSAVVVAKSVVGARKIHPKGDIYPSGRWSGIFNTWANKPSEVTVTKIGTTARKWRGVICASFNAG